MSVARKLAKAAIYPLLYSVEDHKYRARCNYSIGNGFRRIYLYHIPKTAGTSLNYAFLSLSGEKPEEAYAELARRRVHRILAGDKAYVGWDKQLIQRGHYFYAFSHTPAHRLRLPDGTFTITCLRNPSDRVISLYGEYMRLKVQNIKHPMRAQSDKWLGHSFGDFLNNMPKSRLLHQLYMFSRDYDIEEALDNILSCSCLLSTEDFSSGCAQLRSRLGLEIQSSHLRKATHSTSPSPEERHSLLSVLEPEYLLLERLARINR